MSCNSPRIVCGHTYKLFHCVKNCYIWCPDGLGGEELWFYFSICKWTTEEKFNSISELTMPRLSLLLQEVEFRNAGILWNTLLWELAETVLV